MWDRYMPTSGDMFFSVWLFLSFGIGIAESLSIENQLIIDVVDFYNVTLLRVVYEEGAEHNLNYSLCQNWVLLCIGYSEQSMEATINSLDVAMQNGDLTELFFIGTNNAKLLRTLNQKIFTKDQVIFMHSNESDSLDSSLRIDNHIIFYAPSDMTGEVNLLEKYRIGIDKLEYGVITGLLGTWTMGGGFRMTQSSFWQRRSDLSGVNLRTGVLRWHNYLDYIWDKDRKKVIGINGYMADILSILQSKLNFTFTLHIPKDGMYGTRIEGSKAWNGLVGMLMRNEIDLQITGLNWLAERDEVIDYVMPVLSDRTVLIAKISQAQEVQVWVYLNIFSYDVWSTICLTLILFSLYLFILHLIGHEAFVEQGTRERIIWIMGAPVRQLIQIPYELNPTHLSSKISILSFAIGLYVLYAHFTCNLTANMVSAPQKEDITSLEDASRLGYKIGVVSGTSTSLILRRLAERAKLDLDVVSIQGSPDGDYSSLLSNFMEKYGSNVLPYSGYLSSLEIDGSYPIDIKESNEQEVSITMTKDSPYSQLFNYHLQRMDENGVIQRLQKKWTPKLDSTSNMDSAFLSLGYNNLVFPFLAFVIGCSAALLIAFCERVIKPGRFKDNDKGINNVKHLVNETVKTDLVANIRDNPLLKATKRILELEMDINKLTYEVHQLRKQLQCYMYCARVQDATQELERN